jgi:ATP-dependent Clp protease, protease subunit
MIHNWFSIKALNHDTAEVLMYGIISSDPADNNAAKFIEALNNLSPVVRNVNVRINSDGGSVTEGFAIYNAMKRSPLNIECYVDGIAASMGSVVAVGGNKTWIAPNGRMMLHEPSGGVAGNAEQIRNYADQVDAVKNDMKAAYKAKTNQSDEIINGWLSAGKDTWLSAADCIKYGLADGYSQTATSVNEAMLTGKSTMEIVALFNENLTPKNTMNRELLIQALNLKADASDADILAAIQSIKNSNTTLEAKLKEFSIKAEADQKARVTDTVQAAHVAGKITAEQVSTFTALLTADFDNGKKALDGITPALLPSEIIAKAQGNGANTTPETKGKEAWTFSEWMEKDPQGLERMEATNVNQFKALYKAQFKVEPAMV